MSSPKKAGKAKGKSDPFAAFRAEVERLAGMPVDETETELARMVEDGELPEAFEATVENLVSDEREKRAEEAIASAATDEKGDIYVACLAVHQAMAKVGAIGHAVTIAPDADADSGFTIDLHRPRRARKTGNGNGGKKVTVTVTDKKGKLTKYESLSKFAEATDCPKVPAGKKHEGKFSRKLREWAETWAKKENATVVIE